MAMYGYARVSTTDQDLTVQLDALKAAGHTIIRAEKVTGTTAAGREELATLLDGRKPTIDPIEVMKLKAQGLGASEIAKQLGIGRASVYRVTRPIVD